MAAVLAFLKSFEPLILSGFDANAIPYLEKLVADDAAMSADVKVMLNAVIVLMKSIGDAEIPKI